MPDKQGLPQSLTVGRALVILSAVFLLIFGLERSGVFSDVKVYRSAKGELREVELSDGSHMTLNTHSEISVALRSDLRSIRVLRGEACFDVVEDPARPFELYAGPGRARLAQGQFNIDMHATTITLGVIAGTVQFNLWRGTTVTLHAGEGVTYDINGTRRSTRPFDAGRKLAWRGRRLKFEDAGLVDVLEELLRYYDLNAVIDEPSLKQVRVTTELPTDNLHAALEQLETAASLTTSVEDDRSVHVTRRP